MPTSTPTAGGDPWLPADGSPFFGSTPIAVMRLNTASDGTQTLESMPSLECVDVTRHAGPTPSTARFAYIWGDGRTDTPQSIEQAFSTQVNLTKTVNPGDRLLVKARMPDGSIEWIFDGFPYGFEAILHEDGEEAVLVCAGVEKRLWDTPIPGMLLRNGNTPATPGTLTAPNHARTDIKATFNLAGRKNCTPPANDFDPHIDPDRKYPVFLDPDIVSTDDIHTYWTLPKAVAYLAFSMNDKETFVNNPTRPILDGTLIAREPIDGEVFDPADSTTYTAADIVVPELPATGKFWPPVVDGLIADKGFGTRFRIRANQISPTLPPVTELDVYLQATEPVKDVLLQKQGSLLNVQKSNVGACHLSRDIGEAPNRWEVHGAPIRHQIAVVLACGFPSYPMYAATPAAIAQFDLPNLTAASRNQFRLYIADETGEGHSLPNSVDRLTNAFDFDPIFGAPPGGVLPLYAKRRRPCLGDLMPRDEADRKKWRATLYYSRDYTGASPGLWDGTGNWTLIQGGYDLLSDRLGIWINVQNPDEWITGNTGNGGAKNTLRGILSQAAPTGVHQPFYLKLECQVEADRCLIGYAERRGTAALKETVTRVVDARNRYRKETVHPPLANLPTIPPRDDTAAATAEAISLRNATDAGVLDGPVTIPWFTTKYPPGTQIGQIDGRGLGLRTDGGTSGTTPVLPNVRVVHWHLRGDQTTTLTLSDGQQLRKSYKKKSNGRRFGAQGANGVTEATGRPREEPEAAPQKPVRHRTYGYSRP